MQTELAERVAAKLGGYTGTVVAADRDAAKRKRPADLTAYDLYLLGVEAKHRETKESVEEAVRLLKRSVEIDPTFARAWTGLAWCYAMLSGTGPTTRSSWIGSAWMPRGGPSSSIPWTPRRTPRWPRPSAWRATWRVPRRNLTRR